MHEKIKMKKSDQIKKYLKQLKGKETEIIKEMKDLLNSEKLTSERIDFEIKLASGQIKEKNKYKVFDKLLSTKVSDNKTNALLDIHSKREQASIDYFIEVEKVNDFYPACKFELFEDWLDEKLTEDPTYEDFKKTVSDYIKTVIDFKTFFVIDDIKIEKEINTRLNVNIKAIQSIASEKGITIKGIENLDKIKLKEIEFIDDSEEGSYKSSGLSNKLKLTLLYKLGIIDHLRTFDSLKNNDRALSRLLHVLLQDGKPDTLQPYLSAERSGKKSLVPQNNPLSSKLKEEAVQILERTDLTNDEIKKFYPNL